MCDCINEVGKVIGDNKPGYSIDDLVPFFAEEDELNVALYGERNARRIAGELMILGLLNNPRTPEFLGFMAEHLRGLWEKFRAEMEWATERNPGFWQEVERQCPGCPGQLTIQRLWWRDTLKSYSMTQEEFRIGDNFNDQ